MSTPTTAHPTDVHAKALALNLDPSKYGTFAEIGAGQEVARWFLRVGAASGTVAQTISAYDKTFSDKTYGAGSRYVSRERLLAMLDHEYKQLLERLDGPRGAQTCFFAFADTIAARNFKGDNEQHGWIGVRFQAQPHQPPSDILLHINLMDETAQLQQEAIGLLGVNLIYAAMHQSTSMIDFLGGLFDELSIDRLEIDVIELSGPRFEGQDARVWCLQAMRREMAHAIIFDSSARVVEPSGVLRKRPLIVERGRFESENVIEGEMMRAAEKQLKAEGTGTNRDPSFVLEMTIKNAVSTAVAPDDAQILSRVQRIAPIGTVAVSNYSLTYQLVHYLHRHTAEPIRLVMGVATLAQLLHEAYYNELPGSLLEGLGLLLATNVKLYAYPMPASLYRKILGDVLPGDAPRTGLIGADDIQPSPPLNHLFRYLRDAGWIVPLSANHQV